MPGMNEYPLLESISRPSDLRDLSQPDLVRLAAQIRDFLTRSVSRTGGHLASNLGIVEITLALHRVFDFSHDRLVFDVGHQCYVHKLITGRRDRFDSLRKKNGITGFPNPAESEYDCFVVGHASTSISSAVGLATAYRLRGEERRVVAVVGDGAIGGGMCFEAMNHAGHTREDVLVLLNDNDMAIAETVGAFSTYLTDIRSNPITRKLREDIRQAMKSIPVIGDSLQWTQEHLLGVLKDTIAPSHIFSAMGFDYFGPIDGHDIAGLEHELTNLRQIRGPRILHVVTRKGQGFAAAAADPETFHSAVPFEIRGSGEVVPKGRAKNTWSAIMVDHLLDCAKNDERIVAITAAMPAGTGIKHFAGRFPDRFIDVGICEAHSVTFAAGLAKAGMRPVLGIYSTFLQRGYDQLVHDVGVQGGLPLVMLLDRAGLVGSDGPTHHGVFDIAFLRHIPGFVLMAPKDGPELRAMLDFAFAMEGPVAIRYPRGAPPENGIKPESADRPDSGEMAGGPAIELGRSELLWGAIGSRTKGVVFAYGRMVEPALAAAKAAGRDNPDNVLAVVNARFAKPLDHEALLAAARETGLIVTVEDHALAGGFGSAVAELLADKGVACSLVRLGIPDRFIEHGSVAELDAMLGLDIQGLTQRFGEIAGG